MNCSVVLVDPKFTGNIGAVARIMKNFDFHDLYLIDPPGIDEEAMRRAMHAKDVLNRSTISTSLKRTINDFDMVVGTSGIETSKEKKFIRQAVSPEDFSLDMSGYEGTVALLFGREDVGLSNEELKLCDRLIKIPSSKDYPILNLSHAVGIILYELYKNEEEESDKPHRPQVTDSDRERVISSLSEILDLIDYPEHKKERTMTMFRRMLGRAKTSRWEYHRSMGVLTKIIKILDKKE